MMEIKTVSVENRLKPIQCVKCPLSGEYIAVEDCKKCPCLIEVKQPWRYWIVHCSTPNYEYTPEPSIDKEYVTAW